LYKGSQIKKLATNKHHSALHKFKKRTFPNGISAIVSFSPICITPDFSVYFSYLCHDM